MWQGGDGPLLLRHNPASLMVDTNTLRSMGGWDALPGLADELLLWRLAAAGLFRDDDIACPDVPLSLSIRDADHHAARSIAGVRARWRAATALVRHCRERDRTAGSSPEDALPPALPDLAIRSEAELDAIYVGDVSEGAPGLEHVQRLLEGEAEKAARVGVFHVPDPETDWRAEPAPGVLDLIAAGRLCRVQSVDAVQAGQVIVWQRHLGAEEVDGLPVFGARQVVLLCGPQLRPAVPKHPESRRPPDAALLERLFSCPVIHRSI
jgi:hypothetical protein